MWPPGAINAIVGSGSLLAFVSLLAAGYPPVSANICTAVGLVPGGISGALAYRGQLPTGRAELARIFLACLLGTGIGRTLLLILPPASVNAAVPVLILIACALVLLQPRNSRWLATRPNRENRAWLLFAVGAAAVCATSSSPGSA